MIDVRAVCRIEELRKRITDYLENGGLFNPEMMEHEKVRALLIECREKLAKVAPLIEALERNAQECDRHALFCKTEIEKGGDYEHLKTRQDEAEFLAIQIRAMNRAALAEFEKAGKGTDAD
jgi:hypothetical protein